MKRLAVPFVILLVTCAAARAQNDLMTPELLWKLGRVGAPEVSPDGRFLVFTVTRYDIAKNKGNSDLWLLGTADGTARRLTTHEKSDSGARWSPDGKTIGFVSTRDDKPQVYTISPFGGEASRLTDVKEGVADFDWSPDGKHVSYTSEVRLEKELKDAYPDLPLAEARIYDHLLYRHWTEWHEGTYSHLFVAPVAGGAALDLMQDEKVHTPLEPFGGREQIAWSPDGQELCYTAKKVEEPARSTDSDLYLVPAAGGPARCITTGMDGFDRDPLYSPDGRWIAFHSMARATFEADRERLMLYDRGSGTIRELTAGFDHWVGDTCWAPDSGALYFSSPYRGTTQLFRVDLEGTVVELSTGRHDLKSVAISPDGKTLYARRSTFERPFEIVRLPAAGGEIAALTGVNDDVYARLRLPRVEERIVLAEDGADIHCWVTYPPGFDAAKKYPLIVYCQGGPQAPIGQWFSYRWNFHLMAAHGYVVIAPSRRGLPGFGQAWNDAISRDWGGRAMLDYLSATDSMFEEPYIDAKRTAAIGASFGGYSIYWLMGHDREDRFCTMVAHAGLFNLESWYGTTEELWFPDWDLGGPYWASERSRAEYDRNSPHRYLEDWDTPLLVVHGQKDFRVPVTEGMQAFTVAQLKGIPSRLLYFPEEGHWVQGVQNGILWHRVFFDWLDRWCKPGKV